MVIYINLFPLLEMVDEFTTSCGFTINPLRKTIQQMNYSDSMTSGREDVYSDAIKLIKDTNALPNGVASFEILLNDTYYPHNIFLEAGIEFGFIGFIIVAVIIFKACYNIVVAPRKNQKIYTYVFLYVYTPVDGIIILGEFVHLAYDDDTVVK